MTKPQLITALSSLPIPAEHKAIAIQAVGDAWVVKQLTIPSMDQVLKITCQIAECDYSKVKLKNRKREYVLARNLFFYYLRSTFPAQFSLQKIGKFLDRDHTTAIHAVTTIKGLIDVNDITVLQQLEELRLGLNEFDFKPVPPPKQKHPKYTSVKKYIYDSKTGEKFDNIFDLNRGLGVAISTPFSDLKRRFGLLRFEWKSETELQK